MDNAPYADSYQAMRVDHGPDLVGAPDDWPANDNGAWAAQCKARAQFELLGRSARIKAAITQMEMICPPLRIEE